MVHPSNWMTPDHAVALSYLGPVDVLSHAEKYFGYALAWAIGSSYHVAHSEFGLLHRTNADHSHHFVSSFSMLFNTEYAGSIQYVFACAVCASIRTGLCSKLHSFQGAWLMLPRASAALSTSLIRLPDKKAQASHRKLALGWQVFEPFYGV